MGNEKYRKILNERENFEKKYYKNLKNVNNEDPQSVLSGNLVQELEKFQSW